MKFFGDTYFKARAGFKNLLIKLKLYKPTKTLYGHLLSIKNIGFNKRAKKRRDGYDDKEFAAVREYKDKHKGERCFIICTGPSLTVDDVNMLKNEVTFGMNSLFKMYDQTDWRATYYAIADPMVYNKIENDPLFMSVENKWIGSFLRPQVKTDNVIFFPQDVQDLVLYGTTRRFSDNAYSIVHTVNVTYCLLQIAYYMGFKEIYLLGCDFDYSGEKLHFADYGLDKDASTLHTVVDYRQNNQNDNKYYCDIIGTYETAKEFCDAHGVKIFNATRGGKLEVFERVDFDSLFPNK